MADSGSTLNGQLQLLPQQREREWRIDVLKGVAIVAVVLNHVRNQRFGDLVQQQLIAYRPQIDWAVYAFLFASGILHARSRMRDQSVVVFVRSRISRLLVPYFLISLFYALVAQLLQAESSAGTLTHSTTFSAKLQSILRGDPIYGEQMYFFPMLFLVGLLFELFWVATGRIDRPIRLLYAVAILFCVLTLGLRRPPAVTGSSCDMVVAGLLQYSLGFVVGAAGPLSLLLKTQLLLACAGCVVAAFVRDWHFAMIPIPLIAWSMLRSCNRIGATGRVIATTGIASGTVFAYHTPLVLQTLLVFLYRIHVPVPLNIVVSAVVSIVLCVALYFALGWLAPLRRLRI